MATRHTPALLVIDMIGMLDFPGADRLAPAALRAARGIRTLRDGFHDRGWPVIYVNDNFAHWQSDFRDLVAMASATPGAAQKIAELLEPTPDDYFVLKPKHSAFLDTALPILLAKLGVRRLLLTGMALEACVMATAIDGNAREFEVGVVRDGVAGQPPLRAASFKVLSGSKAAEVLALDGAMAWCERPPG